ncbi:MAG: hypothetical protein KGH75_13795 [Rhodospirillales bacterium]|nr:hypothetical protein [Rhodospirillales bacterium]
MEKMRPFHGGIKSKNIKKAHKPLIWENMLGTVYARNPHTHEVKYFDYDYEGAHKHADTKNCDDLRISKCPYQPTVGYPRPGKYALWGIPKTKVEGFVMSNWEQKIATLVVSTNRTRVTAKKLTYKARKNLKPEDFVFPKSREYPVQDIAHARDALSRASANAHGAKKLKIFREVARRYPQLKKAGSALMDFLNRGKKVHADMQSSTSTQNCMMSPKDYMEACKMACKGDAECCNKLANHHWSCVDHHESCCNALMKRGHDEMAEHHHDLYNKHIDMANKYMMMVTPAKPAIVNR